MDRIREMVGLALLSLGLVGFVLPIIPGIPFLLAAMALLGPGHPRLKPWLSRIKRWLPLGRSADNRGT